MAVPRPALHSVHLAGHPGQPACHWRHFQLGGLGSS
ncbi:hypothetical protein E2C01_080382 [Portunus trituberculatus]|uniref:Uncharacterized protein n=1 Tax=Portunus trituberculatus TaxID=210409 RepID=A0A5B7IJK3_PORTR|nr:hypothetical protein [Portunus trituberculatus]